MLSRASRFSQNEWGPSRFASFGPLIRVGDCLIGMRLRGGFVLKNHANAGQGLHICNIVATVFDVTNVKTVPHVRKVTFVTS